MQDSEFAAYIVAHPGIAPAGVAQDLGVSERTVRTYVRHANERMRGFATIVLDRGSGYHLDVSDHDRLAAWSRDVRAIARDASVPQAPVDRVSYLINDLLMRTDWITLEELARILFVSRATVSNDLKQVAQELEPYGLTIERRPHYGIRVTGSEVARRRCLAHHIADSFESTGDGAQVAGHFSFLEAVTSHEGLVLGKDDSQGKTHGMVPHASENESGGRGSLQIDDIDDLIETVSTCVERAASQANYKISSFAYQNLLIHVTVALVRVSGNCYVPKEGTRLERLWGTRDYAVAERIADELSLETGVDLPKEEVEYIAIHLAGKQTIDVTPDEDDENPIISDEIWDIVSQMLECVWNVYRFDFRDNLELRMNLARHIVPLDVRLRSHTDLKNPMLADIKLRYPLAWSMATDACSVLAPRYDVPPCEDEIGYLALSFALALERSKEGAQKKTVLIVCASGAGSARLLEYRCYQEFGDYIDKVVTCDALSLPNVDFTGIDYVFTTVPLSVELPVPVREITGFFNDTDVEDLREMLSDDASGGFDMARYFDEHLFFPHLHPATKVEALDYVFDRVCETREMAPDFRELVWKREAMCATSFGNNVAMPHPLEAQRGETFVAVGLLDEPVVWDDHGHEIQAIFLCSFADESADELQTFFSLLADLLMSSRAIDALVANQHWETLRALVAAFSSHAGRDNESAGRLPANQGPAGENPGASRP